MERPAIPAPMMMISSFRTLDCASAIDAEMGLVLVPTPKKDWVCGNEILG